MQGTMEYTKESAPRIAAGKYRAVPVRAQLGHTQKMDPQVAIEFRFLDFEGDERIAWYGFFTDATTERTIQSLRHCGWQGDDLADLSSIEMEPQEVELVIEHEEYPKGSGKLHARIRWVNRAGRMMISRPMSSEETRAFADRMRGFVVSATQKMKDRAPAGGADGGGSGTLKDDDIPF